LHNRRRRVAIRAIHEQQHQQILTENQAMSSTATSRVTLQLPVWQTARFKLLGLIPLAFFLARLVDYWRWDTLAHIWWNCHVANLTLAIGIFLGNLLLMRLAVLWLILGLPPWLIDMLSSGIVWPVSVLTHLGGAVLGLLVAYRVRRVVGGVDLVFSLTATLALSDAARVQRERGVSLVWRDESLVQQLLAILAGQLGFDRHRALVVGMGFGEALSRAAAAIRFKRSLCRTSPQISRWFARLRCWRTQSCRRHKGHCRLTPGY
jgi:hypothetical protein